MNYSHCTVQLSSTRKITLQFSVIDIRCGATVRSEQQHNQDLRKIYKVGRILEFITFYQNALHLTRLHCGTFLPECLAPRTTQIQTRGSSVVANVHRSLPRLIVSLWQIFYSTVRGLTKFKTRRSLSDEYDG